MPKTHQVGLSASASPKSHSAFSPFSFLPITHRSEIERYYARWTRFHSISNDFSIARQTWSGWRIRGLIFCQWCKRLKSFFGTDNTEREREPKFLHKKWQCPGNRRLRNSLRWQNDNESACRWLCILYILCVAPPFHFAGNSFRMNALCSFATGAYIQYAHRHLFTFMCWDIDAHDSFESNNSCQLRAGGLNGTLKGSQVIKGK